MNVYYNGGVVFNMKLDEVSCFYICDHFYKAFKKKWTIKGTSILRSHPDGEAAVTRKFVRSAVNLKVYPIVLLQKQKKKS